MSTTNGVDVRCIAYRRVDVVRDHRSGLNCYTRVMWVALCEMVSGHEAGFGLYRRDDERRLTSLHTRATAVAGRFGVDYSRVSSDMMRAYLTHMTQRGEQA